MRTTRTSNLLAIMKTGRTSQHEEFKRWVYEMLRVYRSDFKLTKRAGFRGKLPNKTGVDEVDHVSEEASGRSEERPDRRPALRVRQDLQPQSKYHGALYMAFVIITWLVVMTFTIASIILK